MKTAIQPFEGKKVAQKSAILENESNSMSNNVGLIGPWAI
jgi:hypothetical protein